MRVLIACEESQRVCIEFRRLGHIAFSCDIQECSGEHPEWHIIGDALSIVNGSCDFLTEDGKTHHIEGRWDLLIAHPPCTYLSNAGTRHFSLKCNSIEKVAERIRKREDAFNLFMAFINADCDRIAVENPVGYPNTNYRKADQIIHPYYFTDSIDSEDYEMKRTCLWLKNLPLLQRTNFLINHNQSLLMVAVKTEHGLMVLQGGAKNGVKHFIVLLRQWLNNGAFA